MLISANPRYMEAGEYGLTGGTCFVARRLDLIAVARLLWISWCVLGAADFLVFFSPIFFSLEGTRPAASMRPPCLIYLSTSTGVRSGLYCLIRLSDWLFSVRLCLSVCLCV